MVAVIHITHETLINRGQVENITVSMAQNYLELITAAFDERGLGITSPALPKKITSRFS